MSVPSAEEKQPIERRKEGGKRIEPKQSLIGKNGCLPDRQGNKVGTTRRVGRWLTHNGPRLSMLCVHSVCTCFHSARTRHTLHSTQAQVHRVGTPNMERMGLGGRVEKGGSSKLCRCRRCAQLRCSSPWFAVRFSRSNPARFARPRHATLLQVSKASERVPSPLVFHT